MWKCTCTDLNPVRQTVATVINHTEHLVIFWSKLRGCCWEKTDTIRSCLEKSPRWFDWRPLEPDIFTRLMTSETGQWLANIQTYLWKQILVILYLNRKRNKSRYMLAGILPALISIHLISSWWFCVLSGETEYYLFLHVAINNNCYATVKDKGKTETKTWHSTAVSWNWNCIIDLRQGHHGGA